MTMNRELVPVGPEARMARSDRADFGAKADFIAHLLATAMRAPQTRARRRAEPEQALSTYRTVAQRQVELGRALSQSL
jgi:hypothetical protein